MSDTARHRTAMAELPSGIGALNGVVQGFIIHTDWLSAYGVDEKQFERVSRDTLPVAERLTLALEYDPRALIVRRSPARRTVGTCRDFALTLCGFLRSKGVSARVRCGFANYFGDGWEDHWVCEYWDRQTQCWRLSDPQLDEVLRDKCRIAFDPADVPRHSFMTGGQAWMACRSRDCDPDSFGHGEVKGLWFAKVNVMRDHYAVNSRETSAWDAWRTAPASKRAVSDRDCAWLDSIAVRPEQPITDVGPDWPT
jgi:hypothetical protein